MNSLIIATSNLGKLRELNVLLDPIKCIAQSALGIEPVEETQHTFVENALLKARHASQIAKQPALADDSGLVVPALNGAPGIYSARYAGHHASDQDNIQHLLKQLEPIPQSAWLAYFYCAMVLVRHPEDPTPIIACGKINGIITQTQQGTEGFGYDPIFYLNEHQATMAQLAPHLKNQISHRAQALRLLQQQLQANNS